MRSSQDHGITGAHHGAGANFALSSLSVADIAGNPGFGGPQTMDFTSPGMVSLGGTHGGIAASSALGGANVHLEPDGNLQFTYQFTDVNGFTDNIVLTVDPNASNSTGFGLAYSIIGISGTFEGMSIDGEVGTGGTVMQDYGFVWDNAVFLSNADGTGGSSFGIDTDGIEFSIGGIHYNLWFQNGSWFIGDDTNGGTNVNGLTFDSSDAPCFCPGTMILTDHGPVAVEDLQAGDMLVTRFGPLRPVKWIGRTSFNGVFLGQKKAPVRIRAGALGQNLPRRDMVVSPAHAMFLDDRLVLAELLVNGVSITQEATTDRVDYYHVDLGVHDCVIAEGCWSESYAEQDNRNAFHNAAEFEASFPEHEAVYQETCLPVVRAKDLLLPAIRAKLLANLPADTFTTASDVHLLADGIRIAPVSVNGKNHVFNVPANTRSLRLASNASSPAMMGMNHDARTLGVRIWSVTAQIGDATVVVLPDDAALNDGFHRLEGADANIWRWTSGNAPLPTTLLGDRAQDAVVTVVCGGMARYLRAAPAAEMAVIPQAEQLAA